MVLQTFPEYAPTLNDVGVTKTDCDKISFPVKEGSSELPELTKAKALAVINDLPNLEHKGYLVIAQKNGLTQAQVKKVHAEFLLSKNPPEAVVKEIEEIEEIKL